jgi:AcrR family transcriptional regulator
MDSAAPPKETKGERTRRLLLEEAIARFGARGYRATSVSEVARSIGLTQAAAYAYFDSKESLFDAAVDADANALLDQAITLAETAPTQQLIPMLLVGLIGSLDQHPLVHRVLGGQEPEAVARLINLPSLARLTQLIAARVAAGQKDGDIRRDLDPEMFANGAEALLMGLLMSVTQVGQTREPRRQMGVVHLFDRVLRVELDA